MRIVSDPPALSTPEGVASLAVALHRLADALHESLRRLTATSAGDASEAYALLTEEYALRARSNILQNDADRHILAGAKFTQPAMLERLNALQAQVSREESFTELQSTVASLVTFASAISPGKAKTVNFLANDLGIPC